jgi:hypothetical protein
MPALGFLKAINLQGWIGLGVSLILGLMLLGAKIDARHWKKQSNRYEQLYKEEQSAHQGTVINYRNAAEKARASDLANKQRVSKLQEEVSNERAVSYRDRIAAARAAADRLRQGREAGTTASGARGPSVSGVSNATASPANPSEENRLPSSDALIATEQAIQLDELIKWVQDQISIKFENNP